MLPTPKSSYPLAISKTYFKNNYYNYNASKNSISFNGYCCPEELAEQEAVPATIANFLSEHVYGITGNTRLEGLRMYLFNPVLESGQAAFSRFSFFYHLIAFKRVKKGERLKTA